MRPQRRVAILLTLAIMLLFSVRQAPAAPMEAVLFNTSFEVDGWWLFGGENPGKYSYNASSEGLRSALSGVHWSESDRCGISTIYQGIQIPADSGNVVLRLKYYPWSEEVRARARGLLEGLEEGEASPGLLPEEGCQPGAADSQGVYLWRADFGESWTLFEELTDRGAMEGWLTREVNISGWKGQAVWVALATRNNGNGFRSWFYVDEVEVIYTSHAGQHRLYLPHLRGSAPTPLPSATPTTLPTPTPTIAPTATPPPPTATPVPSDLTRPEALTVQLIGQQRQAHGLPWQTTVTELTSASRRHTTDMALNHFTGHTGSDGSTAGQRVAEAGYQWNRVAEIIGWGFTTPDAMMNWWMNSPVHRSLILSTELRDLGPGHTYEPASDWGHYWTVDFATRSYVSPHRETLPYHCTYTIEGKEGGSSVRFESDVPCTEALTIP